MYRSSNIIYQKWTLHLQNTILKWYKFLKNIIDVIIFKNQEMAFACVFQDTQKERTMYQSTLSF